MSVFQIDENYRLNLTAFFGLHGNNIKCFNSATFVEFLYCANFAQDSSNENRSNKFLSAIECL